MTRLESIGAQVAVFLLAALVTALLVGGPSEPAVHPWHRSAAGPPDVAAPARTRLASVAALPAPLRRAAERTATRRPVAPRATQITATAGSSPAAAAQPTPAAPAAPPPAQAPAPSTPPDTAPTSQPTPAPTFDDSGSGPQFDDGGNGP